ncbi:MAG TPA: VIT domain-containing protein [Gemmatimonadales bacterium]|nr:VIT domain-containing protein [Gemmatimonadales bacterium]
MARSTAQTANLGTLLFVFSAISVVVVLPAHAQGWIEIERPANPGVPVGEVQRTASQVRIAVDGRVARIEVEERFLNSGSRLAEGSYLYPMPGEAVFTNFSLWMGDQEVRGETMNAEQARAIYEEIVRRKKDPALLTFAGHGLVRAQVFPIQPGETRKVALRFTQLLSRSGDAVRLRYSLGNRGQIGETSFLVTVPNAASYGTPYSPTHAINTRRAGDRFEISLPAGASGEVELFLPLRKGLVGTTLVTHAPGGEDGYFMLLLAPPQAESGSSVPRDLTLVVDVSGSMSGTKLEQAKAALEQALGTLRSGDRFRLIAFSSAVRRFREDFVAANRDNLTAAREFVDGLGAEGGTNIAGALDAALGSDSDPERLPIVLFVTDGLPSVGEQAPDRIAEQAAGRIGRSRIFTVGLGPDVNTYLLDRLASRGRGSAEYVPPGASVETAMGGLMAKLRYPALVNLRIGDTPVGLSQTYPTQLPDLFYGEELVLFGRYHGQGTGNVVITGERNGRRERIVVPATFTTGESGNDFIPRLWAARQIGELTRQIRLEGASPSLVAQVRELGLRYGILTEYTSYLVQEPSDIVTPGAPVPLREDQMGGARNSAAQTGAQAFDRARASSKLADSKTLAATDEVASSRLESLAKDESAASATRLVAGRLFIRRGQVWTDVAHADRITVTAVAAYSKAYFDLVRQLPEVAPYLLVGDEVLIAGRRASVQVSGSGIEVWQPGQLAEVVRNFRGT